MRASGGRAVHGAVLASVIAVLYTLFYYPQDIFSWYPLALSCACVSVVVFLVVIASKLLANNDLLSNNSMQFNTRHLYIAAGAAVAALAFSGNIGSAVGFIFYHGIRFVIQPFFYIGITWSLSVALFVLFAVCGALSYFLSRKYSAFSGRAGAVFISFWVFVALCFGHFTVFKLGPSKNACGRLPRAEGARLLLSRDAIDAVPGMSGALPYDAVSDDVDGYVFATLKKTGPAPGGVVMLSERDGRVISSRVFMKNRAGRFPLNVFPERLSIDTELKRLFVLVLSPGKYRVAPFSYSNGKLEPLREVVLTGEPNSIYADVRNSRVYVFYAAATRHGYDVFDSRNMTLVRVESPEVLKGPVQHITEIPGKNKILATIIGPKTKAVEIDLASMTISGGIEYRPPLEGISADKNGSAFFSASPFTRELVRFDDRYKKDGGAGVTCGLADTVYEPESNTVSVAGYDGSLEIFSAPDLRKLFHISTGSLLRNVSSGHGGKYYACSGCGVFEITPEKIKR